jgi:hypothetical protein
MPPTITLYHGAHRWEMPPRILPVKAKRGATNAEHGPGIYLTNSVETARSFAKGGGSLMRVELERPRAWLEDTRLAVQDVERFLRETPRMPKRAEVLADVRNHAARMASRMGGAHVHADVLVNLMTNHGATLGALGPALAAFLVSHQIDASLLRPPWPKDEEDWVVVFNPDLILHVTQLTGKDLRDAQSMPRVRR